MRGSLIDVALKEKSDPELNYMRPTSDGWPISKEMGSDRPSSNYQGSILHSGTTLPRHA